jgi:hypothetical protein
MRSRMRGVGLGRRRNFLHENPRVFSPEACNAQARPARRKRMVLQWLVRSLSFPSRPQQTLAAAARQILPLA